MRESVKSLTVKFIPVHLHKVFCELLVDGIRSCQNELHVVVPPLQITT